MGELIGKMRHKARESAVQFLYQCEREKIFYFSSAAFDNFVEYFGIEQSAADYMRSLVEGAMSELPNIDKRIEGISENWRITRMSSIDRCVLRLAVFELSDEKVPKKVVINEAIELAKKYGTEHSGRFVNGLLDKLSRLN